MKAGGPISKGKGKALTTGKIVYRVGEKDWVEWVADDETVEAVADLEKPTLLRNGEFFFINSVRQLTRCM